MISKEVRIGIVASISIFALFWGYNFLKGKNILSRSVVIYSVYKEVEELKISAPVLLSGYQIGIVKNMYQKKGDIKTIIVELELKRGVIIPKDAVAALKPDGVMGGRSVHILFDKQCTGDDCVVSGDTLRGISMGLVDAMIGKDKLESYLETLNKGLNNIVDSLDTNLESNPNNPINKSMKDIEASLHSVRNATAKLDLILAANASILKSSMSNIDNITRNIKNNNDKINSIINSADQFALQLKSANLPITVNKANGAIDSISLTISSMKHTLAEANKAIDDLTSMISGIKKGEGNFGKLVNREDLYDNLARITKNTDLLLQDLRLNPKRYVNVSVFGKKQKSYTNPIDDPAFDSTQINK